MSSCPSDCQSFRALADCKKLLQERDRDLEIASKLGTTLIESQQRLQKKMRLMDIDANRLQFLEIKYAESLGQVAKLEEDRSMVQESPIRTPVKPRVTDSNSERLVVEQSTQIAQLKAEIAKLRRDARRSLLVTTQPQSPSQPVAPTRDHHDELKALKDLVQELGVQNERLSQEKAELQAFLEQSLEEMNSFKETLQLSPSSDINQSVNQDQSLLNELEQSAQKKRLQSSSRQDRYPQPKFTEEDRMDVQLVDTLSKNISNLHKRIKQSAPLNLNKRLRKQFDLPYLTGLSMRILDGLEQEVGGQSDGDALWKSVLILAQKNVQSPNMRSTSPQLISPPLVQNLNVTSPILALDEHVYKSLRVLTIQIGALLKDVIAQRRDANLIREEYARKLEAWSQKDAYDTINREEPAVVPEEKSGFISPAILELSKAFLNKYRPQSRSRSSWIRSQSQQPLSTMTTTHEGGLQRGRTVRNQRIERPQSAMPQSQSMPVLQEESSNQCSLQ